MKEAMFCRKLKGSGVKCLLCPRECSISEGRSGNCRVRKNIGGKRFSLSYAAPCAAAVDPVEKKPMFHFLPGTAAYSIGTAGCNLHCLFCQNWTTSQASPEEVLSGHVEPKEIVASAVKSGCKSIAYTYNEPAVFYEYVLETARLARKKGLKNIIVSNGFIQQEPLAGWCRVIDGANIDIKGFTNDFYRNITGSWIEPVLETVRALQKKKVWLELTNLIIPGNNDRMPIIKKMCEWIVKELGNEVPLHFSGFYPAYKMENTPATPPSTLVKAGKTAKDAGIKYVYLGNVPTENGENTYCPSCGKLLVERKWFDVLQNSIKSGKCACGEKIPGIWK